MKKTIFGLAMCALFFASCSKEQEMSEASSGSPINSDEINLVLATSRANIMNLDSLKLSTAGFVVYGTDALTPTAWYTNVDGTNNYKFATGAWGWTGTAPTWPTVASNYPMNFYAYFATSYTGFTPMVTPATVVKGDYTIQPEGTQIDFLSARATAASKPASGQLVLTFDHMLSKVNFMIVPGNGADVYLQSLNINNVGNKRMYDFVTGSWGAQPTAPLVSGYIYKKLANPATKITGTDINETTAVAAGIASDINKDLMLMPQTSPAWAPVSNVPAANGYMSFVYRLETANNVNAVGYKDASQHPNFLSLDVTLQGQLTGFPLFVKAGYGFGASPFTWDKGKGYIYNIQLGTAASTNGYLVSDKYFDRFGNEVPLLPIIGKKPGDSVSSGTISFTVSVAPWADSNISIQ